MSNPLMRGKARSELSKAIWARRKREKSYKAVCAFCHRPVWTKGVKAEGKGWHKGCYEAFRIGLKPEHIGRNPIYGISPSLAKRYTQVTVSTDGLGNYTVWLGTKTAYHDYRVKFTKQRAAALRVARALSQEYGLPIKTIVENPRRLAMRRGMGSNFIIELFRKPIAGAIGTVRLMPQNYYVATILDEPLHPLLFKSIEKATRGISHEVVKDWMRREGYKIIEAHKAELKSRVIGSNPRELAIRRGPRDAYRFYGARPLNPREVKYGHLDSITRPEVSRRTWAARRRAGGYGTCAYCGEKIYTGGVRYKGRLYHETCASLKRAGVSARAMTNPERKETRPPREWFAKMLPGLRASYPKATKARLARIASGIWWRWTPSQREAFRKERKLPSGFAAVAANPGAYVRSSNGVPLNEAGNPLLPGERYLGKRKRGVSPEEARRRGWL